MQVNQLECKLTSDALINEYDGFSSLSFHACVKDAGDDQFNVANIISCTFRTDASSARALYSQLIRGKRVNVQGRYESQSFECGGDPLHRLCVGDLRVVKTQVSAPAEAEIAL